MVEIIPAIMPDSLADMREKMAIVAGAVNAVQLDIMDGNFVPETTWPYRSGGEAEMAALQSTDTALPFWDELDISIDLMVADPERAARDWIMAGAARVIIHVESSDDAPGIFARLADEFGGTDDLSVGVPELSAAIGIETPPSIIEQIAQFIGSVQVMGIAKIGYQGQPFDDRAISQVRALHAAHPTLTISVDGGVSLTTAPELLQAGATRLVVGSAIYSAEHPKDVIRALKDIG